MNSFKLETSDKHLTRHFPLESKQNRQNTHQIMQIMRLTLVGGTGCCDNEKISNVDIEKELQVISIFSIFSRPVFSNIFPLQHLSPSVLCIFSSNFYLTCRTMLRLIVAIPGLFTCQINTTLTMPRAANAYIE